MDTRQFLAEFGHIANAPEGVQRLREMVLFLGITGRLSINAHNIHTPQYFSEVSSYVEAESKRRGLSWKKYNGDYSFKIPLVIPEQWSLAKLNDIAMINMGQSPDSIYVSQSVGDGLPFYQGKTDFGELYPRPRKWCSKPKKIAIKDDILLSVRAPVGPTNLCIEESCIGRGITAISATPVIDKTFLLYVFRAFEKLIAALGVGTTFVAISLKDIQGIPVPVPSVKEQSRIVAKVDELMALCDKLEVQQQERTKLEASTRKAVLRELSSVDAVSVSSGWERLDRNLDCLFGTPESVDDFEASLKELAVRGVLTPVTAIVPDIPSILQACTELKDRYIADKWMRKQKLVLASDSPVEYPSNWVVMPFDEVAVVIGGVTKGRNMKGRNVMTCPYLSVANVQRGFFKLEKIKTIEIAVEELGKYRVEDGDLLLTEGGDWDKVGRTAIWRGGVENCVHQNHVFKARVPSDHLLNEWVELVFNSNVGRNYFAGASKQTTNLASINMTQLRSFPFPIPPLTEQKAILKKLSVFAASYKSWRSQREQTRILSALFASASVSAITGIRTEEVEELKAPKTELISKLRLGAAPNIKEQAPLAAILARQNGELAAKDLWQRFGGEIDAFYSQLKLEIGNGWILEPAVAEMQVRDI